MNGPVTKHAARGVRPRMVNSPDRREMERKNGGAYPVLFGIGATPILLYIACNPWRKGKDIYDYFKITQSTFAGQVLRRLLPLGLVIDPRQQTKHTRSYRYVLNPTLSGYVELLRLLRAMGRAYGIPMKAAPRGWSIAKRGAAVAPTSIPADLFWNENRTSILAFVASLGEVYPEEAVYVFPIKERPVRNDFRALMTEGILRCRNFGRAKLYSLNPAYPGSRFLRTLLRRIVSERRDIQNAAVGTLIRRRALTRHSIWQKAIIEDIKDNVRSPNGVGAYRVRRFLVQRIVGAPKLKKVRSAATLR